ncbi:MAG: hypothetical protein ACI3ZL_00570 [Candidatus Cryptobacteroides sp.]
MDSNIIPELTYLLSAVEKKYGRRIATSTDFESLSVVIEHEAGDHVSSSTLKRLWGYVSMKPTPRIATLDVLSRYVGVRDFHGFCEALRQSSIYDSTFFSSRCICASDLEAGEQILVGWAPDRIVRLRYLGESEFEVADSRNSQLRVGDRFGLANVLMGYPLYISRILRDGEWTPSYVAGRNGGITLLERVKE